MIEDLAVPVDHHYGLGVHERDVDVAFEVGRSRDVRGGMVAVCAGVRRIVVDYGTGGNGRHRDHHDDYDTCTALVRFRDDHLPRRGREWNDLRTI